jgi:glycosyltransferase involved in cell wall biosynthesis
LIRGGVHDGRLRRASVQTSGCEEHEKIRRSHHASSIHPTDAAWLGRAHPPMLTLDAAIVTHNRAQVLDLSLPLLLKQSRKPNNIFIVDSSDDPEAVANVVKNYSAATEIPITFIRSTAGISVQRNVALKHVTSDIVMFPDDDSLLLPGALEAIMRIYEADVEERIGGVCGREVLEAPAEVLSVARKSYKMTRLDRLKQRMARQRFLLERRFLSDPIKTYGRSRWNVRALPEWLDSENAVLVEYMTGFRMSFLTSLISKYRFDEYLEDMHI